MEKLEITTIEVSMDIKKIQQLKCNDLLWCKSTAVDSADLFKGQVLIGKIYYTPSFIKKYISEITECKVVDINSAKRKIKLLFGGLDEFYYLGEIFDIQKFADKMANGNLNIAIELIKSLKKAGEIVEIKNRKLFFANQYYTLQEFANKMTKGDIKLAESVLENLIKSGSAKWLETTTPPKVGQNCTQNTVLSNSNELRVINMSSSAADKIFYKLVANIDHRNLAHHINELMLHKPIRRKDNKAIAILALSTLLAEHALKLGDEEEYLIYRDTLLKWNEDEMWWPTVIDVIFCVGKDTGVTDKFFDDILDYLEANANEILKYLDKLK